MFYYCYLITSNNLTYIGTTNDLVKRLKQHNGELSGGAKATRRFNDWIYCRIIDCKDKKTALSFEWKWKHYLTKNNKWRRTKSGLDNKLIRLDELLKIYPNINLIDP
jgi:structure-specific endonuclease subunit SLX1